jgi:hypothetical protein
MSKETQLTEAQLALLEFFCPVEIDGKHAQFKSIFRTVAFESEMAENVGGKNALFSLWYLIELLEGLKAEREKKN